MAKKDTGSTRKEAAARAAAQQAAEERRSRTVRILGASVVAVAVTAIIGGAVLARSSDSPTPPPSPDAAAALPVGVLGPDSAYPYAVPYGSAATDKPVLQIWEDFQCPACGQVERANGDGIASLGANGEAQLLYRPATFLDNTLGNDASVRATSAWGCAIDAGKTIEYHSAVFNAQPEREGEGWTNAQLIELGKTAGITDPDAFDTFAQCVNDAKYAGWAVNSNDAFTQSGVTATPTGVLNGTELPPGTLADQELLSSVVAEAAKQ